MGAAATAIATLGMMAARVSQQLSLILSQIHHSFVVIDDATSKSKLQRHAFMVNDEVDCPSDADCEGDLLEVLGTCALDSSVTDNDSMMACVGENLSDDCHDCVCDAFARDYNMSCP